MPPPRYAVTEDMHTMLPLACWRMSGITAWDIRHGMPNWPSFEVRTLRNEKIAVLASPKLLEKRPIRAVADLLDCNLILSEATLIKWPQLFAQHGLSRPESPYTLSFDRSYMTLEAASHGLGFALESTLLAQDYLARGELIGSHSRAECPDYRAPPGFPEGACGVSPGEAFSGMDAA